MALLERIRLYIDAIELKMFYRYIAFFLTSCTFISGMIVFYYYRRVTTLKKQIKRLNTQREDEIRVILETAAQVEEQRTAVDAILSEEPDFKIRGYFENILDKLNLRDKNISYEPATFDREDNYRESEVSAKFEDMNTKELTELLQELEQNPRISTKSLEITASKKKPKTLEVHIVITTLLPKTESP